MIKYNAIFTFSFKYWDSIFVIALTKGKSMIGKKEVIKADIIWNLST